MARAASKREGEAPGKGRGAVAELAAAEAAHAHDPERADLLRRARLFKTSWLELAEALVRVKRGRAYEAWGYAAFDDYARRELRLRQETVDKLTGSFPFLKERAPDVLERDGVRERIPAYEAVDFLRRAEERGSAPPEVLDELRERVLEHPVSLPTLSKQFAPRVFPTTDAERGERERATLRGAAERLRDLALESPSAPPTATAGLVTAIERFLAALEVGE